MPDRSSELPIILEESIYRLRGGKSLGLLDGLLPIDDSQGPEFQLTFPRKSIILSM
jgi:hypothetical protein